LFFTVAGRERERDPSVPTQERSNPRRSVMSLESCPCAPHESLLLSWLDKMGARYPKLIWPCVDKVSGVRCAMAKDDIESDEPIVVVPYECMLCAPNCLRDAGGASAKGGGRDVNDNEDNDELGLILHKLWKSSSITGDCLLAACIVREVLLGEKSKFYPYINFLLGDGPPGTIENWPESSLELLFSPALTRAVSVREQEMKNRYSRVCRSMLLEGGESSGARNPEDIMPYDLYRWSYQVIQARAFGRRIPWSALVPLADCLNHGNFNVRYRLDIRQERDVAGMDGRCMNRNSRGDQVDVPTGSNFVIFPSGGNRYKKGGEVFNSYGRRGNDYLMLDYGFCLEDNEHETVDFKVELAEIIERVNAGSGGNNIEAEVWSMKRNLLLQHGYNSRRTIHLKIDSPSEDGMVFFRVACMEKEELFAMKGSLGGNRNGSEEGVTSPKLPGLDMSSRNVEAKAARAFRAILESLGLCSEDDDGDDDDDGVVEKGMSIPKVTSPESGRERQAYIYRVTRERIVKRHIEFMDMVLKGIEQKGEEYTTHERERDANTAFSPK